MPEVEPVLGAARAVAGTQLRVSWSGLGRDDTVHVVAQQGGGPVLPALGGVPWLAPPRGRTPGRDTVVLLERLGDDVEAVELHVRTPSPRTVGLRVADAGNPDGLALVHRGASTRAGSVRLVAELRRAGQGAVVRLLDQDSPSAVTALVEDDDREPLRVPDRLHAAMATVRGSRLAGAYDEVAVVVDTTASMRRWIASGHVPALLDAGLGLTAAADRGRLRLVRVGQRRAVDTLAVDAEKCDLPLRPASLGALDPGPAAGLWSATAAELQRARALVLVVTDDGPLAGDAAGLATAACAASSLALVAVLGPGLGPTAADPDDRVAVRRADDGDAPAGHAVEADALLRPVLA